MISGSSPVREDSIWRAVGVQDSPHRVGLNDWMRSGRRAHDISEVRSRVDSVGVVSATRPTKPTCAPLQSP